MRFFKKKNLAMLWIKEVKMAKSVDDLMTSQHTQGNVFPNFEKLDAKIASALMNVITNQYFRGRINVQEQNVQDTTEFSEEDTLLI